MTGPENPAVEISRGASHLKMLHERHSAGNIDPGYSAISGHVAIYIEGAELTVKPKVALAVQKETGVAALQAAKVDSPDQRVPTAA